MDFSDDTRTVVIYVSVAIGSFAIVLGLVITCLICRRKRRERNKRSIQESRTRYDKRYVRRYGQPGAPSAGSSSGKAYRSKNRVKPPSSDNSQPRKDGGPGGAYPIDSRPQPNGRPGRAWNSLLSGHPAPLAFKSNSLPRPGTSEPSYPVHETRLAHRHRDHFGFTGKTVSEPFDQQSMDATWQTHYPGRPRQIQFRPPPSDNMSYDSRRSNSNLSFYHHRLYGGRDFTGAGFMSQSIDRSLNGRTRGSQHSLYYDGRR